MGSAGRGFLLTSFASCLLLMTGWWQLSGQEGLSRFQRSVGVEAFSEDSAMQDCVTWTSKSTNVIRRNKNPSRFVEIIDGTETDLERRESFEKIWETNAWDINYKSGSGSSLENTENMRRVLDNVVTQVKTSLNKKYITLLDSSCGDMTWMPAFLENRSDVVFTGFDIVSGNIEAHKRNFAGKTWRFEVHDIVLDPVEKYDIILSRHTFQHLKPGDINRVIANFVQSGSSFLLATNEPTVEMNFGLVTKSRHRVRPVNLLLEPFHLPPPLCTSADFVGGLDISLWNLASINI